MKRDFLEFLIQKKTPSSLLHMEAKKDIMLSFRGTSIIVKFIAFQLIGALFSMSVCPQFGMGLVEGHGITHMFRMVGDWACAAFCGSLFLGSGMLVAFIGMKGEELWWVWRRYKYSLIFLPALLWSALMLTNVRMNFESEAPSYHLVWITTAILIQGLFFQLRSSLYKRRYA